MVNSTYYWPFPGPRGKLDIFKLPLDHCHPPLTRHNPTCPTHRLAPPINANPISADRQQPKERLQLSSTILAKRITREAWCSIGYFVYSTLEKGGIVSFLSIANRKLAIISIPIISEPTCAYVCEAGSGRADLST